MNKITQYLGIAATTLLTSIGLANAQETKTLEGKLLGSNGPLPDMTITINPPNGESDVTDKEGNYYLQTTDWPTSAQDIKNIGDLRAGPNPAQKYVNAWVKHNKGIMTATSMKGQTLDQANLETDDDLDVRTKEGRFILSYTNDKGKKQSKIILTSNEYTRVNIQTAQQPWTKSATIDTFAYKARIKGKIQQGMLPEQTIDTIMNIEGWNKESLNHYQEFTIPTKKHPTINGKLTNIENDEPLANAHLLAWDGKGNLVHTTTDEEGNYTLPSFGTNQIKIIKEGFQTRTTYNKTQGDTIIDWNIYNKTTFPLDAIKELTGDKTLRWKEKPTIYFYKEEQYPQESYDTLEKLIRDVDGMSLGHTKDLEIKYVSSEEEFPNKDSGNPFIFVNFVIGKNSGWGFNTFYDENQEEWMKYAVIEIVHTDQPHIYTSMGEEFGSAELGCPHAITYTQIKSQYHDDGVLNTRDYQPVDSLATKYHFTRTNNAKVSTDTELNRTHMNELDTKEEVTKIYRYSNGELIQEDYNNLPLPIRREIEQ